MMTLPTSAAVGAREAVFFIMFIREWFADDLKPLLYRENPL